MDEPDAPWWWLSFADPGAPQGQQWRGGCAVQGEDWLAALKASIRLGCNPGPHTEVQAHRQPHAPLEGKANRLITDPDEARWAFVARH